MPNLFTSFLFQTVVSITDFPCDLVTHHDLWQRKGEDLFFPLASFFRSFPYSVTHGWNSTKKCLFKLDCAPGLSVAASKFASHLALRTVGSLGLVKFWRLFLEIHSIENGKRDILKIKEKGPVQISHTYASFYVVSIFTSETSRDSLGKEINK